jgi:PAS domain-containing protein
VISSRLISVDDQPCSVTTLRDITQQQRAEAALKASEEKFAKAFHSSPDAITITERDSGRYLEVNDGFCRLTGYSADEVIGRTVYEIGIWADDKQRSALLAELQSGRVTTGKCSGATSAAISSRWRCRWSRSPSTKPTACC